MMNTHFVNFSVFKSYCVMPYWVMLYSICCVISFFCSVVIVDKPYPPPIHPSICIVLGTEFHNILEYPLRFN